MAENYIVLKGRIYDILLPEETKCEKYNTCEKCPLEKRGCANIIDFINDTLNTNCEDGVVIVNHKEG